MQKSSSALPARPWAVGLAATYIVAVFVLFVLAGRILGIRCESFGCTGVGVAWLAWAAGYAVVLGLGMGAGHWLPPDSRWRRLVRVMRLAQLLSGVALLVVWLLQ